jgi:heptosyltransferase-2
MLLSGIKNRIGYSSQKHLTHSVEVDRSLHIRDRVLLLLKDFNDGIQTLDNDTEVYLSTSDINKAKSLLSKQKGLKKIAVAPGSVWATKKWPESHFIELIKQSKAYEIYLIGGPGDFRLCESIIKQSEHLNIFNCAGQLSILESCALIKEMDLVLCNDSAPLHMANAVETNVFAFFGPTVKKFGCYPYRNGDKILEIDLDCRPCAKHGSNKCPLKHHNCMIQQTPGLVFKEINNYFSQN